MPSLSAGVAGMARGADGDRLECSSGERTKGLGGRCEERSGSASEGLSVDPRVRGFVGMHMSSLVLSILSQCVQWSLEVGDSIHLQLCPFPICNFIFLFFETKFLCVDQADYCRPPASAFRD